MTEESYYRTGFYKDDYGNNCWYKDGQRHREDGPAFEDAEGFKAWWINGLRHRLDGPAIIYSDGMVKWYIKGCEYYNINDFLKNNDFLTNDEKILLKLTYGGL